MHHCHTHSRAPRAGVDPITDACTAFSAVSLAVHRPLRYETVVLLLDHEHRGNMLTVVAGTECADDVIEVVEFITHPAAHEGRIGAVVVATVRPGTEAVRDPDPADVDRWLEMSHIAEGHGVEIMEWFVIGNRVRCPRDQLGEPPRW